MEKEKLISVLNTFRQFLIDNPDASEDRVKDHVIRLLDYLGWDILNPKEVRRELQITSIGGNIYWRPDFAVFSSANKKACFIEVKRPRELMEQNVDQLLRYAVAEAVDIAILTNGCSWWFYLAQEPNLAWDLKKFAELSLTKGDIATVAQKFIEYLSKDRIVSEEAVKTARIQVGHERAKRLLPEVWNILMSERSEQMISLIQKETQDRHGVVPSQEDIVSFLTARTIKPEPIRPIQPFVTKPLTGPGSSFRGGGKGTWGRVTVEDEKGGLHQYRAMGDCRTHMGLNTNWDRDMFQAFEEVGFKVVSRPSERDGSGVKLKAPVGWTRF